MIPCFQMAAKATLGIFKLSHSEASSCPSYLPPAQRKTVAGEDALDRHPDKYNCE